MKFWNLPCPKYLFLQIFHLFVFFQNLLISVLKCQNSKFDDDPEVTAYMQVTDLKSPNNNKVYVFNGWTFSSSPSIRPFDHPVYDIWLKKCYS